MFITPSFKKSLIVEQFQGNYLKLSSIPYKRKFNFKLSMFQLKHKFHVSWKHNYYNTHPKRLLENLIMGSPREMN